MGKETLLTFNIGKELFAVNVVSVLEVLEQQQITPVPGAPEHIMGIINFRGEILPVVNTRIKLNIAGASEELKRYVIVFELEQNAQKYLITSIADGVKDVIEVALDEIKPVPEMGLRYDARYVSGVIYRNEDFILLLDVGKMLLISDSEILNQSEEIN